MKSNIEEQIRELDRHWVAAEIAGDAATLDALAVDDFTLVGPAGFVLTKQQWLERYRAADLVTRALSWDEVTVRGYGDTAVAVGVHTQEASYRGHPADGRFRATHIAVRDGGRWKLAGLHFSPIAGAPGRPSA